MSPHFPMLVNESYLEFSYHMLGGGIGVLELQYFRSGLWSTRWSRQGSQGSDWLRAKVTLPSAVEVLRFVSSGSSTSESDVALDAIVAWEPEVIPEELLALCSGGYHTCALLQAEGVMKCWGSGSRGRLGSGSEADIGSAPGEMGASLPVVDLGEPGLRVTQVACGFRYTCVGFDNGGMKCFGENDYGQLGYGHTDNIGDEPLEMGGRLPFVDLGGQDVVQVALGYSHSCVLLAGGTVKCFGEGGYLGLGDRRRPQSHCRAAAPVCLTTIPRIAEDLGQVVATTQARWARSSLPSISAQTSNLCS